MGWIFLFFLISGFCSVLYEVIWLRLCMAQFGVTSALVSIVLSMFMAGLGLGSWAGGYLIRRRGDRAGLSPLRVYAVTELIIGISALVVPYELSIGRGLLDHVALSSPAYYLASGICVGLTLIPWCACMGATIPLGMWAIREGFREATQRSFSFLYLANVLGAVAGATVPPLFVEMYGFRGTLKIGVVLNSVLFVSALLLPRRVSFDSGPEAIRSTPTTRSGIGSGSARTLILLFGTGLTSMGAEVVWIRLFTPYLGTVVYAFALILGVYLAATFTGSLIYRWHSIKASPQANVVWSALGLASMFPLLAASRQFVLPGYSLLTILRLALGIALFSGLLGYVTPLLVDRWSGGDPDLAGKAYAVNVVGCILGPLVAGFLLLPWISERWVLLAFALPWLIIGLRPGWWMGTPEEAIGVSRLVRYGLVSAALLVAFTVRGFYEEESPGSQVRRDSTATVTASGNGLLKHLAVNGIGLTALSPMTKVMAHLPMASLDHSPASALVVCFGMGTTFRSLMTWNTPVTAVELVPSVPELFGYFHSDGPELLRSPNARIVIDDGRRYLERTAGQYDVITLDPPPPVEAAGTSLLYSKEFYRAAKRRLAPGGILQQWLPRGDAVVQAAVARALQESFPYIRVFHSFDNRGFHILASEHPIPQRSAIELAHRLPGQAAQDLIEWGPAGSADQEFGIILDRELPLEQMIAGAPNTPTLQDDRPANEYFFLRQYLHWKY